MASRKRKHDSEKVRRYRINLRKKGVEYKGSKCSICGYSKCYGALEFHHPHEKEVTISYAVSRHWSLDRLKVELDKCILVCLNCHREIHYSEVAGCK